MGIGRITNTLIIIITSISIVIIIVICIYVLVQLKLNIGFSQSPGTTSCFSCCNAALVMHVVRGRYHFRHRNVIATM